MMKIREISRFSPAIYNAVLGLMKQLAPGLEPLSEEKFLEILRSKKTHLLVAELEDKTVAGMLTIATYEVPSGPKAWIEDVVVDESQRGSGIGMKLMKQAIVFARDLGVKSVELTSRPSRTAANQLYRKLGFVTRETNVYRLTFKK
jgi:ribosomal protein S18 acetylase RimI-like enzyme